MINRNKKGNKNKLEAVNLLINNGFMVGDVEQRTKYRKTKDLYGLFDLIGLKKNLIVFVQVSTNKPHTHQKYLLFAEEYANEQLAIIQLTRIDREGWVIYHYKKGFKKTTTKISLQEVSKNVKKIF